MKIPKEFKLFNETIKVIIKDDLQLRDDKFGEAHHRYNEIHLDKNITNKEILEATLFHEITHMILGKMERYELSNDEKFVNVLGQLINQAVNSFRY